MDEAPTQLPPASAVETAITEAAPALQPPLLLTDVLTDELLLQILGFLEAEELARAALACKPLARLCREDELWPPLCRRRAEPGAPSRTRMPSRALCRRGGARCVRAGASGKRERRLQYAGEASLVVSQPVRPHWPAALAPRVVGLSRATRQRSATCTGGYASGPSRARVASSRRTRTRME